MWEIKVCFFNVFLTPLPLELPEHGLDLPDGAVHDGVEVREAGRGGGRAGNVAFKLFDLLLMWEIAKSQQ